jgi:hypothetical protein
MKLLLNQEEYRSAIKSFNNIFAFFLHSDDRPKSFLNCIFKWGIQLGISKDDLDYILSNPESIEFIKPEDQEEALEQVYDLIYIIYLDEIIEDIELLVATAYAEKLGFNSSIIPDMLKALVTAPHEGVKRSQLKEEIKESLSEKITTLK